MIDEEGEEYDPPAIVFDPPKDEVIVIGFALRRLERGALSSRGYPMPLLRMELNTTVGDLTFYMTRDECSQFSLALGECALDA